MIYICLYLIVLGLLFLTQSNLKFTKIGVCIIFFLFFIFSGFRKEVGVDYNSYVLFFDNASLGYTVDVKEIGFVWIMRFISALGGNKQFLFLFCSLITNFFFCKYVLRLDKRFYFGAVLVYLSVGSFFLSSLNLVRQYAAIGIFVYSLQYIQNKKFIPYLGLMLVAAFFFHVSALFLIPIYFLLDRNISLKKRIVILVLLLCSSRLIFTLLEYTPFGAYLTLTFASPNQALVIIFFLISLYMWWMEYKCAGIKEYEIYFRMNYISVLLLSFLLLNQGFLSEIVLRTNTYFMTSYIALIPLWVNKSKSKVCRIGMSYIFLIILFLYFFRNTILKGELDLLLPYNTDFVIFK